MLTQSPQHLCDRIYAYLDCGDIRRAGPAAEQIVQQFPDYAPGWAAFSEVWLRCGRADLACEPAASACRLAPDSAAVAAQHAKCLVFAGHYRKALETAERALSLQPQDHVTLDTLGNVFSRGGEHQRALEVFRVAFGKAPENTTAMYNLATSLRFFDHKDEAEALLERVLELDPSDFQALHARSVLRRQTASSNHISELEERLGAKPDWLAASHIGYALGKEYDDLGQARQAFAAYRRGAALMRENLSDDLPSALADVDAAVEALADPWHETTPLAGHDSEAPIFVIGLPRTGSTLIERILDGHPEVFAAGELHQFGLEAKRHLGVASVSDAYGRLREDAAALDADKLGLAYLESTRPRTGHTRKFVDKMPRNDLWAALIHRVLPNARFILTRRDPMDTGYALFRTRFHTGYHFTYDLERIGHYLMAHRRLADALRDALPEDALLEVDYEELVRSPESQARRLLDFCGLQWHDEVLDFHDMGGAVVTASSHQVREPFHTRSIGKWRQVAGDLEPLRRVLIDSGIHSEDP